MKFIDTLKKIISKTCVMFTALTFLFVAVLTAMDVANSAKFFTDRLLILLLFSFIASLASLIFSIKKLHIAIKIAVDFVICYLDMYACVFGLYFNTSGMKDYRDYTPAQIVVASVVFVVGYIAVIAVKLLSEHLAKKRNTLKPYTRQFTETETEIETE